MQKIASSAQSMHGRSAINQRVTRRVPRKSNALVPTYGQTKPRATLEWPMAIGGGRRHRTFPSFDARALIDEFPVESTHANHAPF